ncbi:MAG: cytochrome b/b6 domain-containing protein [Magnetococcales bacterium]|nr:cytochrome b/b6 domain-containing protein [Magnetococcales bacterium]
MAHDNRPATLTSIRVWDPATRLFHWLLVAGIINAWLTWKYSDPLMRWHMWNGYGVLSLILFRIAWGVFGSSSSRFRDFLRGPRVVLEYLRGMMRGECDRHLGHNPLGGWSVVAMLVGVLVQGVAGLFASDDIMVEGPLTFLVSGGVISQLSSIHRSGYYLIGGLVALHLLAVAYHWVVKKDNLILPMITGHKHSDQVPAALHSGILWRSGWSALLTWVMMAGLLWTIINVWHW